MATELVEVRVLGITIDPTNNQTVVVLKEIDSDRVLPIWVGPFEAGAIAMAIEKIKPPRPIAYDLISDIIQIFNLNVVKVIIESLKDGVFYAQLVVSQGGKEEYLDCRPSDSIAIAVRVFAPIYVKRDLFETSSVSFTKKDINDEEEETKKFKDFIKNLKPSDFKWH
ncbi:bifunctional nuclease family protein [Thermodesulfobium sp. 4217-1]|uniref:bifunctional nuclease family protein n=1 Tax=Thermodesulfobium sp. 4217-1 TaxID=3120013 RepID=UPI0032221DE8